MKHAMQKVRKAVLPAIYILPVFGILAGIGYALCPAAMQGGAVTTPANRIGWFLSRIASAVYDNRGFLTAVSAGYVLSGKRASGAFGALIGILLYNSFSASSVFVLFAPEVLDQPLNTLALYGPSAVTGLLLGCTAAWIVSRKNHQAHPVKTIVMLGTGLSVVSVVLIACRLLLFHAIAALGTWIISLGTPGTGLFAFLNRLLAPSDLHRPLNYMILGEGGAHDMDYFWGQVTDMDPGKYMSGFFAPMMFGIPAACMVLRKRRDASEHPHFRMFLLLCSLSAFSCGLCEPFEYWLLLSSPLVYVCYALIFGIAGWLSAYSGFRAGFACSGGLIDLIFSAAMPAARNAWMVLVLGAFIGVLFFLLFRRFPADNGAEFDIIEPDYREVVK